MIWDTVNPYVFSKNGSSILKQLVVITFLIKKYLYFFSYHHLNLGSRQMTDILQATQLQRNLFKIEKKITRYSHHRTMSPFDLVLVHFLFWLYTFHVTPCGSFLFRKRDRWYLSTWCWSHFLYRNICTSLVVTLRILVHLKWQRFCKQHSFYCE